MTFSKLAFSLICNNTRRTIKYVIMSMISSTVDWFDMSINYSLKLNPISTKKSFTLKKYFE